jgi:hypothetical protein
MNALIAAVNKQLIIVNQRHDETSHGRVTGARIKKNSEGLNRFFIAVIFYNSGENKCGIKRRFFLPHLFLSSIYKFVPVLPLCLQSGFLIRWLLSRSYLQGAGEF